MSKYTFKNRDLIKNHGHYSRLPKMKKGRVYALYISGGLDHSLQVIVQPVHDVEGNRATLRVLETGKAIEFNLSNAVTYHEIYEQSDLFT